MIFSFYVYEKYVGLTRSYLVQFKHFAKLTEKRKKRNQNYYIFRLNKMRICDADFYIKTKLLVTLRR